MEQTNKLKEAAKKKKRFTYLLSHFWLWQFDTFPLYDPLATPDRMESLEQVEELSSIVERPFLSETPLGIDMELVDIELFFLSATPFPLLVFPEGGG